MVDVVIPIYKTFPDKDDMIALNRAAEVLGHYDITFVHPKSMNINQYERFSFSFIALDDFYFEGIHGYNQLMLSEEFYRRFTKKYILIYQTDCFVFKDSLRYWCNKDYDYIGAPWLRSFDKTPFFKAVWDQGIYTLKRLVNYNGNGKWQKNKMLLYNEVGNGGLSLRKREKFIEILQKLPQVKDVYLDKKNTGRFYAEDVFFSIEHKRNHIEFYKPNYKEACKFAIENKPEIALVYTHGEHPFGCHRWNKENRGFWKKYFEQEGYSL